MDIKLKVASIDDLEMLIDAGETLFDGPIKKERAREFLTDDRHHMILAYHGTTIVGMVSGVHYVHPDKEPEMFINEASVIDKYQGQGVGKELVRALINHGEKLDARVAWVLTDVSNTAARKCYTGAGGIKSQDSIVLIEFKNKEDSN